MAIDSKRPTADRDGARGAEHRGRNRFREVTSSTLGLAVVFSEAAWGSSLDDEERGGRRERAAFAVDDRCFQGRERCR